MQDPLSDPIRLDSEGRSDWTAYFPLSFILSSRCGATTNICIHNNEAE